MATGTMKERTMRAIEVASKLPPLAEGGPLRRPLRSLDRNARAATAAARAASRRRAA